MHRSIIYFKLALSIYSQNDFLLDFVVSSYYYYYYYYFFFLQIGNFGSIDVDGLLQTTLN